MPKYTLGIDIGGTKIQTGLVNNQLKVIDSQQFPLKDKRNKKVINNIINIISTAYTKDVMAIGLAMTGWIDYSKGIVNRSPIFPKDLHHVNLKKLIKEKFKHPVFIDNDANAIALAEAVVGRGKNKRTVMSLTLGTGVGAGIVIDKKIFRGGQNATEFGHSIIDKSTSFQDLVSGPAMAKHYFSKTKVKKTPQEIEKASKTGNKNARLILKQMSQWLAHGLYNAIYSYSPDIIVLGGGLARLPELTKPAIQKVKKSLYYHDLGKTPIVITNLHYDAGVVGAALLTRYTKL